MSLAEALFFFPQGEILEPFVDALVDFIFILEFLVLIVEVS